MVRTGADPRGAVHGHPRRRDRERRAAVDPGRPRVLAAEPAVGDQRIRARVRRLPAARRAIRRPPRPPSRLHGRNRHLHDRLAPVRPRVERRVAHCLPRVAGSRGRDHHPGSTLDPRCDVRGGPRAQHRAGGLGSRRRRRSRRRGALRRHPHRPPVLGVDLLRQRPGRNRRTDPGSGPALGEPRQARSGLRRSRRGPRHLGSVAVRARRHSGTQLGLGLGRDHRRLHRLGGAPRRVRRLGATREGSARAVLDLQAADADRRERRRSLPRHGDVRNVPDADAVHAAGSRVLATEDRGRATWPSPAPRSSGRTSLRLP